MVALALIIYQPISQRKPQRLIQAEERQAPPTWEQLCMRCFGETVVGDFTEELWI